jgi:hypothetical protein
MTVREMNAIVAQCDFPEYGFDLWEDQRGAIYLQGFYDEADVKTGLPERQQTRRWFLSPSMSKSEIVQTVFKCVMTSMEHRAREHFRFRERAVFGPHFNVDRLWELCEDENLEYRRQGV